MKRARTINLDRYLGKWYEIAHLPFFFQRNCTLATATYIKKDDYIQVINSCKRKNGTINTIKGKAYPTSKPSVLGVRFFPLQPRAKYIIEFVDENYQFAIVGSSGKNLMWILSRRATIPVSTFNTLIKFASYKGYDISRLIISRSPR